MLRTALSARFLLCWAGVMAVLALGGAARPPPEAAAEAPTVHVVFGNHLDVGFWVESRASGSDAAVLGAYFSEFLPRAVWVADAVKALAAPWDPTQRYVYTTHAWLLDLFLDCPVGLGAACPDAFTRGLVARGIREGSITWHAHPHNAQYEFYPSPWAFSAATGVAHGLDARFGLPNKTAAILRDVPGITRAAIPLMRSAGVRTLSIGVNTGSAPPGVPKFTPFLWRDAESGQQLLVFVHPGGYGGLSRPYPHSSEELFLDPPPQCITAPGLGHVLCTSWRNDNTGPPTSPSEVFAVYQMLRNNFPGSKIVVSSFEAFSDVIWAAVEEGGVELPVVTGEIGDTWVHGVASDPLKTARFRSAARAAAACAADAACPSSGPAWSNFTRLLMKIPEHTWGADVKSALHDTANYAGPAFTACARGGPSCPNYEALVDSWRRQGAYQDWALSALPQGHPVAVAAAADDAARAAAAAAASEAALAAAGAVQVPLGPGGRHSFRCGGWSLEVDADSGGLSRVSSRGGVNWAGPPGGGSASFARPLYSAYSEESFDTVWDTYAYQPRHNISAWFFADFGKPNLTATWDQEVPAEPGALEALWTADSGPARGLWLRYSWPGVLTEVAGAPQEAWVHVGCGGGSKSSSSSDSSSDSGGSSSSGSSKSSHGQQHVGALAPGSRLHGSWPVSWVRRLLGASSSGKQQPTAAGGGGKRSGASTMGGGGGGNGALTVTVSWRGKQPTRIPEALWLQFGPGAAADAGSWRMAKLGGSVSPLEVVVNGSHAMHAVGDAGVSACSADGRRRLAIGSLDAALVSPGAPRVLPDVTGPPDMGRGVSFNLLNNVWGTNYIMWWPYDGRGEEVAFRFTVEEGPPADRRQCSSAPAPARGSGRGAMLV